MKQKRKYLKASAPNTAEEQELEHQADTMAEMEIGRSMCEGDAAERQLELMGCY